MVTTKLKPARNFGPGYFIQEQMDYRNWIQEDLAEVMGITPKHLSSIMKDKQPLTLEMAKVLSEVFETSPQYWINLDANYRLWLETEKSEKELNAELKAKIYERMPIRDMIHKGWLPNFSTNKELYESVNAFWGMVKFDLSIIDSKTAPLLARKSESYNQYNAAYALTWYQKASMVSRNYHVMSYNRAQVLQLYENIHRYSLQENGINQAIYDLNAAGVIFFTLPHLQKTYLDGAAFFSGENPVVVYTGRYKRVDNFWFTLAHELSHVLFHLDSADQFFIDNFSDESIGEVEEDANKKAAKQLKHEEILHLLEPKMNYLTKQSILACASELQIHPAIIIGKLAHEDRISYSNQRLFNENVFEKIDAKFIN